MTMYVYLIGLSDMMKKSILLVALAFMLQTSAFAQEALIIRGRVDPAKVRGITVVTSKDGKVINDNLKIEDISWINQVGVDSDGYYSISIPQSVLGDVFKSNVISDPNETDKVYVSPNGSDNSDGTTGEPYASLEKGLAEVPDGGEIVLLGMITVPPGAWYTFDKSVKITGSTQACGLDMTSGSNVSVHMNFRGTFENMTFKTRESNSTYDASASKIFACGNKFVFGENLIMTNPMDVVAGHSNKAGVNSTDLTIRSGTYRRIIGGGSGSPVSGDTHITVYEMNEQYSADDDKSNYYDSRIFGGGTNGGTVGGDTYIDFKGGTVGYIVGGGNGTTVSGDTNINISGGQVMNVYGAQVSGNEYRGNTNITMTGGKAEGLFGGSNAVDMIGNACISVTGGEVTRRIYGGCYNDWGLSGWKSDAKVVGDTVVTVSDGVKFGSDNDLNKGIFAGSRRADNSGEENSVLIFTNGAYEDLKKWIPTSGTFVSHHDYLVMCSNGIECKYKHKNTVEIPPHSGTVTVNGMEFEGGELPLAAMETNILLTTYSVSADAPIYTENDGLTVKADVVVGNAKIIPVDAVVVAGVYDRQTGNLLGANLSKLSKDGDYVINIPEFRKTNNAAYKIRVFVWKFDTLRPLCNLYMADYE